MDTIEQLLRENIRTLRPYISARDEYTGDATLLDANENPEGIYNRYPDPHQRNLKKLLSEIKQIDTDQIFLGFTHFLQRAHLNRPLIRARDPSLFCHLHLIRI